MSELFDNKELFLQPKTTQHGSHMVMTNVYKDRKKKYINIDTRFSDEPNTVPQLASHTITLPERITDVKSIFITNVEIPDVMYNISSLQNNNCILFTNTSTNTKYVVTITDNKYGKIADLHTELNAKIRAVTGDNNITVSLSAANKSQIVSTTNTYTMNLSVDSNGNFDRALLNSKLGWVLGFRNTTYTVNNIIKVAEALPDIFGPKYIYLAIDEFSNSNKRSFVSPLSTSLINKNIIARISISNNVFGFNNLISANRADGYMISDKREYNSKVDIQKLNVQILNEYGNTVCLNGLDFSFCMEVEHQ
jgi:hypothetical protein